MTFGIENHEDIFVAEAAGSYGVDKFRSYRDLRAWQAALELSISIYQVTENFPETEKYCLSNQIRRSSISIPSNIAEGWGRESMGDFQRALGISLGSLRELETQLILAARLGYFGQEKLETLLSDCDLLGRQLYCLRKSVEIRRSGKE